jgi:hypothetical protein
MPWTEHVPPLGGHRLCQGNFHLIPNQGISLDKALASRQSPDPRGSDTILENGGGLRNQENYSNACGNIQKFTVRKCLTFWIFLFAAQQAFAKGVTNQ